MVEHLHRPTRRVLRVAGTALLPLAAALLLGGCAAPSRDWPSVRPAASALPQLDRGQAASLQPGLSIERWWQHFGDPELEALVAAALERNADLSVAAARLRQARAAYDEARGASLPAVDLSVTHGRSRTSADVAGRPDGAPVQASNHGVTLTGQYELDLWGRLASASHAARERLAATAWARAAIEWSLSAQVAEAHFANRALQRKMEIGQAVRELRARTVELRRTERDAGAGSEFELRRAEAELASADGTLAALDRQRIAWRSALSLLTGEPIAELGRPPQATRPLDPAAGFQRRLPDGPVAELLVRRPDLRQAEAEVLAARADLSSARAATLPALRLSGSVGSDVRELSNLFSGPGLAWSLAGSVLQSVFDGDRRTARVEQADAQADAALAAYRGSVAAALIELREAYAAFDTASRSLTAEQQHVAALERAVVIARAGVRAGALTQLDALDAERNHFQAQLAEVDAYRELLVGQVAAFKALGGGHAADMSSGGGHAADVSSSSGHAAADSKFSGAHAATANGALP